MKNPLTLAGIEPATFRFVAQHLNHCATAVPMDCLMEYKNILWTNKNDILSEWMLMKLYTENTDWNRSIKYGMDLMSVYWDIIYSFKFEASIISVLF